MSISVQCSCCGKKLKAKDELAGKRLKCPVCRAELSVPPPAGAAGVRPESAPEYISSLGEGASSPGPARWLPWGIAVVALLAAGVLAVAALNSASKGRSLANDLEAAEDRAEKAVQETTRLKNQLAQASKDLSAQKPDPPNPRPPLKDVSAPPGPARKPSPPAEQPVLIVEPGGIPVVRFTPRPLAKAQEGECLALYLLVTAASGQPLDKEIARAGGDALFYFDGVAQGSVMFGDVFRGGKFAGSKFMLSDKEGRRIKEGTAVRVSLFGPPGRPLNLRGFGAKAKVSAAVGFFKVVQGDYVFSRFATPVFNAEFPTGQ